MTLKGWNGSNKARLVVKTIRASVDNLLFYQDSTSLIWRSRESSGQGGAKKSAVEKIQNPVDLTGFCIPIPL